MSSYRRIPYSCQWITNDDRQAVYEALGQDFLTQGPLGRRFEESLATKTKSHEAILASSGTAALMLAYRAAGIGPGTSVILPAITFIATAAAAIHCGAEVILSDVLSPERPTLSPSSVEDLYSENIAAIVAVDMAGCPAEIDCLRALARKWEIAYLHDASHACGASWKGTPIGGSVADASVFSFHAIKALTTGEGGAVLTNNVEWAEKMRRDRSHGIQYTHDHMRRSGVYDIHEFGYNMRLSDVMAALGYEQYRRIDLMIGARRSVAAYYQRYLSHPLILHPFSPPPSEMDHAWHLYQLSIDFSESPCDRDSFMSILSSKGIETRVHYIPLYRFSAFAAKKEFDHSNFPISEDFYRKTISIPCFPTLTVHDQDFIIECIINVLDGRLS